MKYYIGMLLIITAYIFSIYFIYSNLVLFSIIIYLSGGIAILLSAKKVSIKWISIVLPLILWFPIIWFVFQVSKHFDKTHQKIDLIVSEKFNGAIIIVNNVPCAKPLPQFKGREQLDIPDSGVFLYNDYANINETWSNFYIKNSIGQKTKIYPSWVSKSKKINSKDGNAVEVHSLGNSGISLMLEDSMYRFTSSTVYIGSVLTDEFYDGIEHKHHVIDSLLEKCLLGK